MVFGGSGLQATSKGDLWRKNVRDLEVLRPEVDSGGYDLALEFRGVTRHMQLKSSYRGAQRSEVTAHVKLMDRPSACISKTLFAESPRGEALRAGTMQPI